MALAPKFAQLRGDFFLRNITKGETALTPVFDATSGGLTPEVSTEDVQSNGNKRGIVFSYETSRALTLNITARSRHSYMLNQYLLGTSEVVPAAASVAIAIPALEVGQAVHLGAANVTAVTAAGLVENVDYEIVGGSMLVALKAIAAIPTGAKFAHDEYTRHGVFNAEAQHFEIVFVSAESGTSYVWYRGLLVPSGELSLLAANGIGEAPVTFKLMENPNAPESAIFGRYGNVYNG